MKVKAWIVDDSMGNKVMHAGNLVEKIRYGSLRSLQDTIVPNEIQEDAYTYTLPAHATAFLGQGINYINLDYYKVQVVGGQDTTNIDWTDQSVVKIGSSFLNKYHVLYEIESEKKP